MDMVKLILEKKVGDDWIFVGAYSLKYIEPLCAMVGALSRIGWEMYENLRVRVDDGA